MEIVPYLLIALLGAGLAVAFPKEKQLFGWLTAGVAGALLLLGLMEGGSMLGSGLREFLESWGIPSAYGKTVVRIGLTSLAADFGAQACRDAGSGGLGMKLELCGKVLIALEALPTLVTLLEAGVALLEAGL